MTLSPLLTYICPTLQRLHFIDILLVPCLVVLLLKALLAFQIAAHAALGGLEERRVVRETITIDALGVGTAGCVVIEGDGAPAAVLWACQRRRMSVVAEIC